MVLKANALNPLFSGSCCNLQGLPKFIIYNYLKLKDLFNLFDWHGRCNSSDDEL